jgi:transcriptional regulator with XRE-family HTH domain
MWGMWLSCHTQEEIAEAVGIDRVTVTEFLREMSENFRRKEFDIFRNFDPELYTIWNFAKSTNEVHHPGNIPPEILDNLDPEEAVDLADTLEPMEREEAKERQRSHTNSGYEKFTDPAPALDKVASAVGMSRPTLVKAPQP